MGAELEEKYSTYSAKIRSELKALRRLILAVAKEENIDDLRECLKWGEPSFTTKKGNTVRIDWKKNTPNQLFVFFHCKTNLVDTFKELYPNQFEYSDNRAIVLEVSGTFSQQAFKHCIALALNYHKLKHLPLLGV